MYKPGDKIKFKSEKKRYTIKACNERYLVCTKPFNLKKGKYIYTIVDLEEQIRGTDHWVMGKYNHNSVKGAKECLDELISGECQISRRNQIKLDIE